jgi:hypothetical protein
MKSEVDRGVRLHRAPGDRKDVVVGFGRHQVGDQSGDSTGGCGGGLGPDLLGRSREGDVLAEMDVGVNDAGQDVAAADVELLGGRAVRGRCDHSGDHPVVDEQIGSLCTAGQDHGPADHAEIDGSVHDAYLASSSSK